MNTTKERWWDTDDREWSSTRSKENGAEATEEIMAKNFPESMNRHQSERALDLFLLYKLNIKSASWLSPALELYMSKNQSYLKRSFSSFPGMFATPPPSAELREIRPASLGRPSQDAGPRAPGHRQGYLLSCPPASPAACPGSHRSAWSSAPPAFAGTGIRSAQCPPSDF